MSIRIKARERLMTTIRGYDTSGSLSSRILTRTQKTDGPDQSPAEAQDAATGSAQDAKPGSVVAPLLSSSVQSTLIANQTADSTGSVTSGASAPSANQIAAADILALDTVHALDSNHNGTLSKSEIAAVSPLVAVASGRLDTNNDGQVSAGEISSATLSE
ncbi:hypothetical protein CWS72_11160 [Telmatospirillum siberiense]|uniref:EF-hand domain-containing protein n=2 Tax=Telmatospirillum siberiense TaxID=382514 RepID=A0A2N3PVH3_9PROT|nr:hypothetical protein CWS72_11160 [Telmatospirillum siberiense]